VVLGERARPTWGGDVRRAFIFSALAVRTGAVQASWQPAQVVQRAIRQADAPRWPWTRRARPYLASADLLPQATVDVLPRLARAVALDVHDDPGAQRVAFGLAPVPPNDPRVRRWRTNLDAFRLLVVPSASFAELAGLEAGRVVVVPNGTDTRHVLPGPFPSRPTVGMVSGAAPGRGIETLVEAARMVRGGIPDLRLILWLAAKGGDSLAFVNQLRASLRDDAWVEVTSAPYDRLGEALASATVLVVPHPPNAYLDVAVPVKLLDGMAAGRPVVVTPRRETVRIVEAAGAGVVTDGDGPEALAEALHGVLEDPAAAGRMGAAARRAAEEQYDWNLLSALLADRVLAEVAA
jgi:glycosyltransferase involved in cell wall biosynthesis